jgi:D-alanyl-D-alanine carboxypeptidase
MADSLQAMLDQTRRASGAPAMGVAVVQADAPTTVAVSGLRARGARVPVQADDRWHLGSNTKAITATLAARMAQQGVIELDEPLRLLLPPREMHPALRAVTLRDLLSHRAGLATNPSRWAQWRLRTDRQPVEVQRRRLSRRVLARPPAGPPGRFRYSNVGYGVAGAALEVQGGQPWERLTQQHLFAPLAITTAGFGAPGSRTTVDQPRGHRRGWIRRSLRAVAPGPDADNAPIFGPAGTLHLSLEDWARFARLHLAPSELLPAEWLQTLHAPIEHQAELGYALGWAVRTDPRTGEVQLQHAGSNTLWFALIRLLPAHGVAILLTANSGDATVEAAMRGLLHRLTHYLLPPDARDGPGARGG